MDERLKRVKRVTDLIEYRNRRIIYDMPKQKALNVASWVDVDRGTLEQILKDIDRIKE